LQKGFGRRLLPRGLFSWGMTEMNCIARFRHSFNAWAVVWVLGASSAACAQDAARGAGLYMRLSDGVASCVSCHGPEPQGSRNNLLRAAGNPQALTKALATVGVMSYLRASLADGDVEDLAAFLQSVQASASAQAALALWPLTADFGVLNPGGAAGPQRFLLINRSASRALLSKVQVQGDDLRLEHDCGSELSAGASCSLQVTRLAGRTGFGTAAVVINSASQAQPLVAALSASVVSSSAIGALAWVPNAQAIDFGQAPAGQSAVQNLSLINNGLAPVTLGAPPAVAGSWSLTGDNLTPLSVSGCAAGTVLAPAETCQVRLQYQPATSTRTLALLQLRSNGTNPPALTLRALGANVPLAVNPQTSVVETGQEEAAPTAGGALSLSPRSILEGLLLLGALFWLRRSRKPE
jgi:cytochrome c553